MNALDDIAKVKPLTLSREATIFGGVLSHKVTQEPNPQVAFAELPRANLALELLEVSMWCEPSSPLSEETGVELRCPSGMVLLFIFVLKMVGQRKLPRLIPAKAFAPALLRPKDHIREPKDKKNMYHSFLERDVFFYSTARIAHVSRYNNQSILDAKKHEYNLKHPQEIRHTWYI